MYHQAHAIIALVVAFSRAGCSLKQSPARNGDGDVIESSITSWNNKIDHTPVSEADGAGEDSVPVSTANRAHITAAAVRRALVKTATGVRRAVIHFVTSSTAFTSTDWKQVDTVTSQAACELNCTYDADCLAYRGNPTWTVCETTSAYVRTSAAWSQDVRVGSIKYAEPTCPFQAAGTTLDDPSGTSGSPWVLVPAKNKTDCETQCAMDKTCVAYKGHKDNSCTSNAACNDWTCFLGTAYYLNASHPWETDSHDWSGGYKSESQNTECWMP